MTSDEIESQACLQACERLLKTILSEIESQGINCNALRRAILDYGHARSVFEAVIRNKFQNSDMLASLPNRLKKPTSLKPNLKKSNSPSEQTSGGRRAVGDALPAPPNQEA